MPAFRPGAAKQPIGGRDRQVYGTGMSFVRFVALGLWLALFLWACSLGAGFLVKKWPGSPVTVGLYRIFTRT
jgi:hypothetical protein